MSATDRVVAGVAVLCMIVAIALWVTSRATATVFVDGNVGSTESFPHMECHGVFDTFWEGSTGVPPQGEIAQIAIGCRNAIRDLANHHYSVRGTSENEAHTCAIPPGWQVRVRYIGATVIRALSATSEECQVGLAQGGGVGTPIVQGAIATDAPWSTMVLSGTSTATENCDHSVEVGVPDSRISVPFEQCAQEDPVGTLLGPGEHWYLQVEKATGTGTCGAAAGYTFCVLGEWDYVGF